MVRQVQVVLHAPPPEAAIQLCCTAILFGGYKLPLLGHFVQPSVMVDAISQFWVICAIFRHEMIPIVKTTNIAKELVHLTHLK